jgi:hypothetical protein
MAKQLINVGSQANDGTGDNIRSGGQKINAVIEEIYNDLGDGTNLQINIGNITTGNVLRSNGTDFVSAQLDYGDLSGRPTIPAAQVQSDWNATSGVSSILNKPNLSTVATTGSYNDLTNKPNILIPVRTTASGSTASISNNASENITISAAKSYALLKIQTSAAAWVTLYTDASSRTADSTRSETTDPLPGSGIVAEVITSGASTQIITPATIGWNNDSTPSENIYLKVVNKSGSTTSITVTVTYIQLES